MKIDKNISIIVAIIFLVSCSNSENIESETNAEADSTNTESVVENDPVEAIETVKENTFEYTALADYTELLTPALLQTLKSRNHAEMNANDGIEKTAVKLIYFTPPYWEDPFAYVQVSFSKGEVTENSYVFFYPDQEDGRLSEKNARIVDKEDYPCEVCQIKAIQVDADGEVYGHFFDRSNPTEEFTKSMFYNFEEMFISWTD